MSLFRKIGMLVAAATVVGTLMFSCKPSSNNKNFYDPLRDTIAPKVTMSVPLANAVYKYGDDIHMVGVVTDLEITNRSGKLKSLNLTVNRINSGTNEKIKELFNKNLDVNGKEGYTINQKMIAQPDTGVSYCQLMVSAQDMSGRISKDSILFSIIN